MKKYVFQFIVEEGCDHFWDDINQRGVSGCDEVLECIQDMLTEDGDPFQPTIKLVSFEDR